MEGSLVASVRQLEFDGTDYFMRAKYGIRWIVRSAKFEACVAALMEQCNCPEAEARAYALSVERWHWTSFGNVYYSI